MESIINTTITDFTLPAFHKGCFATVSSENLKGKWSILFFYPNDFCFVCPTELADMARYYNDFRQIGVDLYAVCPDSKYAHRAWFESSPYVSKVQFPMLSDCTCQVGKTLGVVGVEGVIRSTFLINPEGLIKLAEYQENGVGRSAKELFRKTKAAIGYRPPQ